MLRHLSMWPFVLKVMLTSIIVASVSEISKRSSLFAAILASLPLTSILAMIWIYAETKDTQNVIELSTGIFWMVLPSLFFFVFLPVLIRLGVQFYPALISSCSAMAIIYWGYVFLLRRFGITI